MLHDSVMEGVDDAVAMLGSTSDSDIQDVVFEQVKTNVNGLLERSRPLSTPALLAQLSSMTLIPLAAARPLEYFGVLLHCMYRISAC